jgi:hypothetical protein
VDIAPIDQMRLPSLSVMIASLHDKNAWKPAYINRISMILFIKINRLGAEAMGTHVPLTCLHQDTTVTLFLVKPARDDAYMILA